MISDSIAKLPRFYAILDAQLVPDEEGQSRMARELVAGGVTLIQYRNKTGTPREILDQARSLRASVPAHVRLILNDRADLCLAAGYDGVHVGQEDLSPAGARSVIGPERWLGVSTHNPEQVAAADVTSADYIAVGPVFATSSTANPDPVIDLEGVRRARALTSKPLVAIGGITRENCQSVIAAGADSVAVISDLLADPRGAATDFLRLLQANLG